jgi:hypothetical protein
MNLNWGYGEDQHKQGTFTEKDMGQERTARRASNLKTVSSSDLAQYLGSS